MLGVALTAGHTNPFSIPWPSSPICSCTLAIRWRRAVRFALSVEISSIYKKNGRTRKVHNLVHTSGFEAVERLNRSLRAIGNFAADGRPILPLDCRNLLDVCLNVSDEVIFIPAHIWTPHFAALSARSGFDSLEECYGDLLPYIHAVETGLSSDPPMNRRLSALDRVFPEEGKPL